MLEDLVGNLVAGEVDCLIEFCFSCRARLTTTYQFTLRHAESSLIQRFIVWNNFPKIPSLVRAWWNLLDLDHAVRQTSLVGIDRHLGLPTESHALVSRCRWLRWSDCDCTRLLAVSRIFWSSWRVIGRIILLDEHTLKHLFCQLRFEFHLQVRCHSSRWWMLLSCSGKQANCLVRGRFWSLKRARLNLHVAASALKSSHLGLLCTLLITVVVMLHLRTLA